MATTSSPPIGPLINNRQPSLNSILQDREQALKQLLRVCIPGVIQSWDAATQTATVQVALTEQYRVATLQQSGQGQYTTLQNTIQTIKPLKFVPIVTLRAGGFSITMPIQPGDECLLVFADQCIDSWWTSGCPSTSQSVNAIVQRRHSLSDAFFIPAPGIKKG